jgi:hypothetical protein
MGRSKKIGLDYFPFDIGLFHDIKVRKLVKYQSGKAITVYAYLLCLIYENGYYMQWDKELPFVCSECTGFEEVYILETLHCCLSVGLFDKDLYEQYGILTSAGIQSRWLHIMKSAKRVVQISQYWLLGGDEPDNAVDEQPDVAETKEEKPKPSKRRGRPRKPEQADTDKPEAPEVAQPQKAETENIALGAAIQSLAEDVIWYEPMCMRFRLSEKELLAKLSEFHSHCTCLGHDSYKSINDAKRHFCAWLAKDNKQRPSPTPVTADNSTTDDFGAADY